MFGAGAAGRTASGLPTGLDQPFKVELIEDLVSAPRRRRACADHQHLHPGRVHRPLPRPARAQHGRLGKGTFKLTSLAGAYWRGDEHNADAHAHLRHRLREQGGAGGVSRGPRDGPPARPPPHRPRPRPLQLPRGGPRLPLLPPQGHAPLERHHRLLARRARQGRLRGGAHAADPAPRALGARRATGRTTRRTCTSPRSTGSRSPSSR